MNKFLILILFIALIYLAYSYRHNIMRGGFVNLELFQNENIFNDFYTAKTKDELKTDIYKLYMIKVSFETLVDILKKTRALEDPSSAHKTYGREITGKRDGTNLIYSFKRKSKTEYKETNELEDKKAGLGYIDLGKLINSEKFKGYVIRTDAASRTIFYNNTSIMLIDIDDVVKYINNGDTWVGDSDAEMALHKAVVSNMNVIPYYIDKNSLKVYAFDLWKIDYQNDTRKKLASSYNADYSGKGEFKLDTHRNPGLFIDSNEETMNERDNSLKVGPTSEFLSKVAAW